ncbi:MAPEG family protein [Beijerinckia sp. L45]|uniref:MAPEG family protein n=1 Tax=Beijerinckia sp. L45 TaxID=1641855 RepID=UPI00131BDA27|nr:MAPEG family protein [Beijerinckia sp. L45]
MTIPTILLPVFIEVTLVFVLLGFMAKSRADAMNAGTRPHDIALSSDAFPRQTRQISNCYANQFEMPLLFIAAVILAIVIRQAGTLFVLIEWLFVIARIGHAVVHTTSNNLSLRGPLFLASAVATALLWLILALGVLFGIR